MHIQFYEFDNWKTNPRKIKLTRDAVDKSLFKI